RTRVLFPYTTLSRSVDRLQEYAGMDRLENLWITCYGGECPQESIDALRSMTSPVSLQIACPPDKDCPLLAALDSLPELKMRRLRSEEHTSELQSREN